MTPAVRNRAKRWAFMYGCYLLGSGAAILVGFLVVYGAEAVLGFEVPARHLKWLLPWGFGGGWCAFDAARNYARQRWE